MNDLQQLDGLGVNFKSYTEQGEGQIMMKRVVTLLAVFILGLRVNCCLAQEPVLVIGESVSLRSNILDEERPLFVQLPEGYSHSQNRYPVLYLLDADWAFHQVTAIAQHLRSSERIPDLIVVGIPNIERDGRSSRSKDLTPAGPGDSPTSPFGGAAQFLDFIADEVMPYVESHYRTHPHCTLTGHSLGGLFTVYALLNKPEACNAYIAISPSLGRNNQQQVRHAAEFFADQPTLKKAFHLSVGNEGGNTLLGTQALVEVLENQGPEGFDWHFEHLEEEDHVSVTYRSNYDALESIFNGWKVPESLLSDNDVSLVKQHYDALSERLGFEIVVPETYYRLLGYRILAELDFGYAQWTFEQYLEVYPDAAAAFVGLGDVFLMQGELEQARHYYERALKIDPNQDRALMMQDALR